MPYGPIELLVLEFPGNQFSGEITPALAELVDSGTIRIIDILFVQKDADGNVIESELSDLTESDFAVFDPVIDELAGLLTHEDALYLTSALAPNSSAGIMLFENVWARRFTDAVVQANGRLIVNERIPRAVIEELVAAHAEPEPIA
jgi:hypothetical protein